MRPQVQVEVVSPRLLAAVGREVAACGVRDVWRPALDQVWEFDFGVEVAREFAGSGEVRPVRTPAGEAAVAKHVGPYDGLAEAHRAIRAWAKESSRSLAGTSWEIYGDWNDDPAKLVTLVVYLLC
jgi:hypothetical protein